MTYEEFAQQFAAELNRLYSEGYDYGLANPWSSFPEEWKDEYRASTDPLRGARLSAKGDGLRHGQLHGQEEFSTNHRRIQESLAALPAFLAGDAA